MRPLLVALLLLPVSSFAQEDMYLETTQELARYETQSVAHGRDYKSLRVTTTYHRPFVQTWTRKDGAALTAADAALLANRRPLCPVNCMPFVVDDQPTGRTICRRTGYQKTEMTILRDAVVIDFDCYHISGYITGQNMPSNTD